MLELQQQLEQLQKQQRQQQLEQLQERQQEQLLQQLVLVQERLLLFCCMRLKRLLTGKLTRVIFSFVNFQYRDQ